MDKMDKNHTKNIVAINEKKEEDIARSELNLEKNSIFTVSTYKGKSREVIITDESPAGKVRERRAIIGRTIQGLETGVLTTQHFKVYLALIKLWEEAGRQVDKPVKFTIFRIIQLLDLVDAGPNYGMIKQQLVMLRQIPLTFIDSFFMPNEETYRSLRPFSILNHLEIYERGKTVGQTRSFGEFQFDRYILENLVNNHVHPLRLDIIRSFKKHRDLSILLYTYIDRNLAFASRNKYEVGLEKLFQHLDLSQNYIRYPSQRKQKIQPICKILEGRSLSTGMLSYCRIHRVKNMREYKLVCHKKPFPKKIKGRGSMAYLPESIKPEAKPDPEFSALLTKNGLTEKQAMSLISMREPGVIRAQIDYLSCRLKEYEAQGKPVNTPAILYDSVKENWGPPAKYIEAERRQKHEAERCEQERIARLEKEERDKAESERLRMEAYKDNLDHEERAKLRERALEGIRGMAGIKEGFIGEPLIASKENELLRGDMKGNA